MVCCCMHSDTDEFPLGDEINRRSITRQDKKALRIQRLTVQNH